MAKTEVVQGIEIHDGEPTIDPIVGNQDLGQLAASEAFLNEMVTVMVHPSTNENDSPQVIVNVNGTNQLIIRGRPTNVKRKYLEVLARMKETKFTQSTPNPSEPEKIQMSQRNAWCYPFEVVDDANPRGRAWLSHVMAEAA